jgi:hypothetical protein
MAKKYYSPQASIYHYLHMAGGNYRAYLKGDQVWLKKYFDESATNRNSGTSRRAGQSVHTGGKGGLELDWYEYCRS